MFYISREKQKFSRSEVEGGKVGRLDVGKIGRFEGGKARKNLRKVAVGSSLPSSLLIPSTIPSLYLPHKNFSLVTFGHQSSTKYTALAVVAAFNKEKALSLSHLRRKSH